MAEEKISLERAVKMLEERVPHPVTRIFVVIVLVVVVVAIAAGIAGGAAVLAHQAWVAWLPAGQGATPSASSSSVGRDVSDPLPVSDTEAVAALPSAKRWQKEVGSSSKSTQVPSSAPPQPSTMGPVSGNTGIVTQGQRGDNSLTSR